MSTEEELEAVSAGLMEGYGALDRLKEGGGPPGDAALDTLDAMERALLRIQNKEVTTSMIVRDEHLQALRQMRAMVEEWNRTGKCPEGLPAKADELLALEGT